MKNTITEHNKLELIILDEARGEYTFCYDGQPITDMKAKAIISAYESSTGNRSSLLTKIEML